MDWAFDDEPAKEPGSAADVRHHQTSDSRQEGSPAAGTPSGDAYPADAGAHDGWPGTADSDPLRLGPWPGSGPATGERAQGTLGLSANGHSLGNGHASTTGNGHRHRSDAATPPEQPLPPEQPAQPQQPEQPEEPPWPGWPQQRAESAQDRGRADPDAGLERRIADWHERALQNRRADASTGDQSQGVRQRDQDSTPHTHDPAADSMRAAADAVMAACHAAEGQNMFGGYGTSGLTPVIKRIAARLPAGGLAPGSEADTLKPAARFIAKLARLSARNPGVPAAELAAAISDGVRYAFAFEEADYTEATWLVHRKLKSHGFDLLARRNRWESPEYKGIFTCWREPAHGITFEVQFHTLASWAVARRSHDAYLRITDPKTGPTERAQLRARQVSAAAAARVPPGCREIADYRLEPR